MSVPNQFTAHNIRLDDGTQTFPQAGWSIEQSPILRAVKNLLRLNYPGGYAGKTIVDIGCLEGGYATEFARLGLKSLGIDIRPSNIDNANYVKSRVNLPDLRFEVDNAWNIVAHGPFDVIFCTGLYYHIEDARRYMAELSKACRKILVLETHFAPERDDDPAIAIYRLSPMTEHEGMPGRWFIEHDLDAGADYDELNALKWASWENKRSFWPTKGALLAIIREAGFDMVLEDYDKMAGGELPELSPGGWSHDNARAMFVGIRLDHQA